MSYIRKMSFRHAAYQMPQFRMFFNLSIAKKLSKQKNFFNFTFYFSKVKGQAFFFETLTKEAIDEN